MREELTKVYEATKELKELLDQEISSKNRETIIEELNEQIATRGTWMEKLNPPYTDEEQVLGEQIYQMNIGIEKGMQELFSALKLEMKAIQKQKKSQQSYVNPYKAVQVSDGTYLDSKN